MVPQRLNLSDFDQFSPSELPTTVTMTVHPRHHAARTEDRDGYFRAAVTTPGPGSMTKHRCGGGGGGGGGGTSDSSDSDESEDEEAELLTLRPLTLTLPDSAAWDLAPHRPPPSSTSRGRLPEVGRHQPHREGWRCHTPARESGCAVTVSPPSPCRPRARGFCSRRSGEAENARGRTRSRRSRSRSSSCTQYSWGSGAVACCLRVNVISTTL